MKVVLSGVSMKEGGILTIFREIISAFSKLDNIELICLVHDKRLFPGFESNDIQWLEFPEIKQSWFSRINFEYFYSKKLNNKLQADIWFSLHDMSANVFNCKQFVYCHNPSPFFKGRYVDYKYDKKFWLFTLFYKYLYKINVKRNTAVVVQQSWIADKFYSWFTPKNIIIARPVCEGKSAIVDVPKLFVEYEDKVKLFYPAFPRTFKNFDVIIDAFNILKIKGFQHQVTLTLTFDSQTSRYAEYVVHKCKSLGLENIHFSGVLTRDEMVQYYNKCDVVVFSSKLETWGLPISEAKEYRKPILLADLPYAHETLGDYSQARFFDCDNSTELSEVLLSIINKKYGVFENIHYIDDCDFEKCNNWDELVRVVLA